MALPSLFISHGAPSLLIEPGPAHDFLAGLAADLGQPRAVVCISAHWEAAQPYVTGAERPPTVHDFFGFDEALKRFQYPAPGEPAMAQGVLELLTAAGIAASVEPQRGLDHGAWVPLALMYPQADVPVLQVALAPRQGPAFHLALGRALAPLRERGVLVMGSGAATHDLAGFRGQAVDAAPVDYAQAFDQWLAETVTAGRLDALVDYERMAPHRQRNHPSPEHFLPLLVAAGAGREAAGRVLHDSFTYGVLSMRVFAWD